MGRNIEKELEMEFKITAENERKKPRRVSNLGLLANTCARSKNEDEFDDPPTK